MVAPLIVLKSPGVPSILNSQVYDTKPNSLVPFVLVPTPSSKGCSPLQYTAEGETLRDPGAISLISNVNTLSVVSEQVFVGFEVILL